MYEFEMILFEMILCLQEVDVAPALDSSVA